MGDIYAVDKTWIQTRSGNKFWPMDPRPQDIRIDDIAHALSQVGRFTGHTARFYSVAEHSCHVARCVLTATGDFRQALQGLLHDASEAYLADIAKPVKIHPAMAEYREAEKKLERMILERFGVWDLCGCYGQGGITDAVHEADARMLATEARDLLAPLHPDWRGLPEPYGFEVKLPWSPTVARRQFAQDFSYYYYSASLQ